jgi:hypothetical protein
MNEFQDVVDLLKNNSNQLDLLHTLLNFFICLLMALILKQFYINNSSSLSGKLHVAKILPILSGVIFLVIVVVKSSLALSLGLVGALSIVRFRTPIKEPEELVYLFLAISLGLGYGAGYTLVTTVLSTILLAVIYFWLSPGASKTSLEYNLIINWSNEAIGFENMKSVIEESVEGLSLVRLEIGQQENTAVMLVSPKKDLSFDSLSENLKSIDRSISLTFFEANTNW